MDRRWAVFGAAASGTFLGALDLNIVPVAFTDIRHSFPGTSLADLSWVTTGYATTFAAALLPAGALADRLGRKRIFLIGFALFAAASAACALAPSAGLLIAARLVQGVGGGTLTPLALALILPAFPDARGTAIGLWSATASAAATAGPALGGLLVGVASWRLCFAVAVPLGAVAIAVGVRVLPADPIGAGVLPDGRVQPGRRPDLLGAGLLAVCVGAGSLAVTKGGAWGWLSWPTLVTLAGAVGLGVVFAVRTRIHPAPLVRFGLLAMRPVRTANLALLLFGVVYFAVQLANALYLTGVAGYDARTAGLALTPGAMVSTAASYLSGRASQRLGHGRIAVVGVLVFAVGCLVLAARTGPGFGYPGGFLVGLLIASAGTGVAFTALAGAAVLAVPAAELGTGSALSVTSRAIGASLGFAALAALLDRHPGGLLAAHHVAWVAAALGAVITAVAALRLGPVSQPAAPLASREASGR